MIPIELSEQNITIESFSRYVEDSRFDIVHENNDKTVLEFLAVSNAFGGEAGELQNVVKKIVRSGVFYDESDLHEKFTLEAGDALHYLLSLIQLGGYDLQYVMALNVKKLEQRKHEAQNKTAVLTKATAQS